MKEVTNQFVLDHPNDLIGLVSFARVPRVLIPLTLDHAALIKKINAIDVIKNRDQDGTAIGYAIYKTVQLIAATRDFANNKQKDGNLPFTIKGNAVIVVTDGFQDPNALDKSNRLRSIELDDAASFAKKEKIHIYIINVDPSFSSPQFAPHRRQLESITKETGGGFYMVNDRLHLQDIYKTIDRLEKGTISQEAREPKTGNTSNFYFIHLYRYLIAAGVFCLLLALVIECFVLRQIP